MASTADAPTRVWLDDQSPVFRRGLASSLEGESFDVVGESTGLEPEPAVETVDLLVFALEGMGLQRAERLTRRSSVRLIGLVWDLSDSTLMDTLAAGASGVLVRSELTPSALVACLTAVANGHGAVPQRLLAEVFGARRVDERPASPDRLARRELNVLRLLAEGEDTRQIASQLAYSERTVKNIIHDILVKLNGRTRSHAVALATRQGLI